MQSEKITLETTDRVRIVGTWVKPANASRATLLLHMMPATKESYAELQAALYEASLASLAIDLRGHGESTEQTSVGRAPEHLDHQNFSDAGHQASRLDIDAAMNFLKIHGFAEDQISLTGASIGANLALDALVRYSGTKRAVLLSPGLDYRGVQTGPTISHLAPQQRVWIVAAEGDSYSAESAAALAEKNPQSASKTIFKGLAHGTSLFATEPKLTVDIVKFLQS